MDRSLLDQITSLETVPYLSVAATVATLVAGLLVAVALVVDSPFSRGRVSFKAKLLSLVEGLKLRLIDCSLPLQAQGRYTSI